MLNRRVVVTGLGLLTPLGKGVKENWKNILLEKSCISRLTSKDYQDLPCQIAGQINTEHLLDQLLKTSFFKKSDLKTMSMANIFALIAADEAIKDSGWSPKNEFDSIRSGVSIAIGMSGITEVSDAAIALNNTEKGFKTMSPYFVPKILSNMSSGLISIKYQLKGPNHCVTTACAAGAHSILDSFNFIKNGLCDMMVCGATEACIHPVSIAGFSRMRALATKFNETPEEASCPFDINRNGFVMSEGAGVMVLETLENAEKRNAKIYGEVLGGALNADASHITNPSGDGAFRCMKLALDNCKLKPEDIDYINAHSTSTPAGDLAEINAIKKLFNTNNLKHDIYISSMKGALGHLLGASGAVELILTAFAGQEKIHPPSTNIKQLDPELKMHETPHLKIIQQQTRSTSEKFVSMKNSFGFGGTNVSLCIANYI